jgi:hypothetical protein
LYTAQQSVVFRLSLGQEASNSKENYGAKRLRERAGYDTLTE